MGSTFRRGVMAALLLGIAGGPALAELGGEDYRPRSVIRDEAERARVRAEIAAERRRETERAEQRARELAAEEALRRAAIAAEAARRPAGQRLAEAHCGTCHAPEVIAAVRHTWLGWHLTVLRMRFINGARIPRADGAVIIAYLSQKQPAGLPRTLLEYGTLAGLVMAPGLVVVYAMRRRKLPTASGCAGSVTGGVGGVTTGTPENARNDPEN